MSILPPALLVASLIALAGSVAIALAAGALRFAGAARLALSDGSTVETSTPSRVVRGTTHAGVVLALALLAAALIIRTVVAGHAPWSNLYEFSQSFAAGILLVYLLLEHRAPIRGIAPIVALLSAALVGYALTLDPRIDPLVPALQQPFLLTIHVGSAMLAYAISAVAFAATVAELVQRRVPGGVGWLPEASVCRVAAHRAVLLAFPVLTAAIALGSVWANLAWRSYWSNDPKELAAAATWLVYGAYLHVAGRRDRYAAIAPWLLVLGFGAVLFTYIGAGLFFVGEHSYAAP